MKPRSQNYMLPTKTNTALTGIFVFAIIIALSGLKITLQKNEENLTSPVVTKNLAEPSSFNPIESGVKNGQYRAMGNYTSPGGPETILVDIHIENGTIVEANAEVQATRAVSKRYQREFVDHFKPMVIGKNIAELKLDKVAGSSLTPKGFNEALQKILSEAKS